LSEVLWTMVLHLALTFKGGLGVVACFALFAFWAGGLSVAQHLVCMTCILVVNSASQPQQHLESAAIVQSNLGTNNSWHIDGPESENNGGQAGSDFCHLCRSRQDPTQRPSVVNCNPHIRTCLLFLG